MLEGVGRSRETAAADRVAAAPRERPHVPGLLPQHVRKLQRLSQHVPVEVLERRRLGCRLVRFAGVLGLDEREQALCIAWRKVAVALETRSRREVPADLFRRYGDVDEL